MLWHFTFHWNLWWGSTSGVRHSLLSWNWLIGWMGWWSPLCLHPSPKSCQIQQQTQSLGSRHCQQRLASTQRLHLVQRQHFLGWDPQGIWWRLSFLMYQPGTIPRISGLATQLLTSVSSRTCPQAGRVWHGYTTSWQFQTCTHTHRNCTHTAMGRVCAGYGYSFLQNLWWYYYPWVLILELVWWKYI